MAKNIRLQFLHGTADRWTSVNPILSVGETGYETDTGKTKIGDGTTAWISLAYQNNTLPAATVSTLGGIIVGTNLTINGAGVLSAAGSGDVDGPASSVNNELVRFDSTTGKLIEGSSLCLNDGPTLFPKVKSSGIWIIGGSESDPPAGWEGSMIALYGCDYSTGGFILSVPNAAKDWPVTLLSAAGNVDVPELNLNSHKIINLLDPTADQDAATKAYVDSISPGAGTVTEVTGTAPISVATGTSTPVISMLDATAARNGYATSTHIAKLNGIEGGANNYVLPKAAAGTIGGVRVGTNLTIDGNGILSADNQTGTGNVSTDVIWVEAGDMVRGTGLNAAARLPIGAAGKYIKSNGTTFSWEDVTATPGGLDTYIQFNDGSTLSGDSGFTFDKTANSVFIAGFLGIGAAGSATASLKAFPVDTMGLHIYHTDSAALPAAGAIDLIHITEDTIATSGGAGFITGFQVTHNFGGTDVTGGRQGIAAYLTLTAKTTTGTSNRNYVGVAGYATSTSVDGDGGTALTNAGAKGALFGAGALADVRTGGVNFLNVSGMEINVAVRTGGSALIKTGLQISAHEQDKVHGTAVDAGLAICGQLGAVQFNDGLLFTDLLRGTTYSCVQGVISTGTLIRAEGSAESPASYKDGIDFSAATFSGSAIRLNSGQKISFNGGTGANRYIYYDSGAGKLYYVKASGATQEIASD